MGFIAREVFQVPVSTPNFTPLPSLHLDTDCPQCSLGAPGAEACLPEALIWESWLCPRGHMASSRFPDLLPQDVGRLLVPHLHWVSFLFLLL